VLRWHANEGVNVLQDKHWTATYTQALRIVDKLRG
jgi:hypothetical protein